MLAFIIFGTRGIRSTIKEGQFACPQCASQQPYKHKKVTQFFTLYFIPLIPLGKKGDYIECQKCRNTFVERVLGNEQVVDVKENEPSSPKMEKQNPPVAASMAIDKNTSVDEVQTILQNMDVNLVLQAMSAWVWSLGV